MPQIIPNGLVEKAKAGDVRAQIRLGQLLEAAGQLDAGLDWLARAAQTNDVEALALVGLRLISGRYERNLALRGVHLLFDAMNGGSAQAATRLSVLSALGLHLHQDWSRALDYLQKAAELGGLDARQQLIILAGDRAAAEPELSSSNWAQIKDLIDIGRLLEPGASTFLNENPAICAIKNFASPAICDWIIRQSKPLLKPAEVYSSAGSGALTKSPSRNNDVANFSILDTNFVNLVLQTRIAYAVGVPLSNLEAASVLRYMPGQQAAEHFDFLDSGIPAQAREIAVSGQRVATALVYLNDTYQKGTTDFPRLGLSYKARRGDVLLFRNVTSAQLPEARSEHAGRPPEGDVKWVFSNFVRARPTIDLNPANGAASTTQ